jgi:6-phosphogluconolactonase/glucosamine-6-phosphate isomerase/deaminase
MPSPITTVASPREEAARRFAAAVVEVDRELGWARAGVSGSVAASVWPLVRPLIPPLVWSRLRLVWTDDATLGPSGYGRDAALSSSPASLEGLGFELPLIVEGEAPEAAMKRVTRRFADQFSGGIDVALLALGRDGSVAGLFPGHPARFSTQIVLHVVDAPLAPDDRLTLGFKALRTPRVVVVLAEGEPCRTPMAAIRFGDPLAPVNVLPGDVTVLTDQS